MPLNVDSLNAGTISQNGEPVKPYKVYTALLNQTGTDAPVATVLENTLGLNIIWSYDDVGKYLGLTPGLFTDPSKVAFIFVNAQNNNADSGENGVDEIYINTYGVGNNILQDNALYNAFLEIRVYN